MSWIVVTLAAWVVGGSPSLFDDRAAAAALPGVASRASSDETRHVHPRQEMGRRRRHTSRHTSRHRRRVVDGSIFGRPGACGDLGMSGFAVSGHRFSREWLERTLHGVIANHCRSKHYQDILALDGGTVGISHFATGSLRILYEEIDLPQYFGTHARRIPGRPYRLSWWRAGMSRFLASSGARQAQLRAWRRYITPSLAAALEHGWTTDRALAIAASIANSLGAGGFRRLARRSHWQAELAMRNYAHMSQHKERRRMRLDREFPPEPPATLAHDPRTTARVLR